MLVWLVLKHFKGCPSVWWCLLYTELYSFWGQSSQGESFSWGLGPEEAVDRSVSVASCRVVDE